MSISKDERIEIAASKLYLDIYESKFGGKNRGRFLVNRSDLKELLDVSILTSSIIEKLAEECLSRGLVLINMDDVFGFMESDMVFNWRKAPSRIIEENKNEIDSEFDTNDEDEYEDDEEELV